MNTSSGEKIKITVVIPFFNAYDFFEASLNSILEQSHLVNEIIVVNDGCGLKADKYLNQFSDIKVISLTKNQGPSAARNIGVKAASYPWIAFLDADDIWQPNKIEKQINFLIKNPTLSACHTGVSTFDHTGTINTYINKPFDLTIDDLLKSAHVTPPSLLIKKSVLEKVGHFDETMYCAEDHDLSLRIIEQGYKIGFINEALIRVRRMNHGNLSSSGRKLLIGNYQLFKKNYHLFKRKKGASPLFMYSVMMTAGGKSKGLEKKLYYGLGKLIKIIFRVK